MSYGKHDINRCTILTLIHGQYHSLKLDQVLLNEKTSQYRLQVHDTYCFVLHIVGAQ